MNVRKYQYNIEKNKRIKKCSYLQTQNTYNNNSKQQIKENQLNNSLPLNNLKSINNRIYKDKEKKKIQINIYNKPFKIANGDNTNKNNIRSNYIAILSKNKNKDFSLINLSNELYNTIDLGRNAINNIIKFFKLI